MSTEPMLFCLILGCLISLLVIPLMLLPRLQRSLPWMERRPGDTAFAEEEIERPVPKSGGLALAAAFVGVFLLISVLQPAPWASDGRIRLGIVWTALAMFFIGFWDDIRPLGVGRKLFIQTLISVAASLQGIHFETASGPLLGLFSHLGPWTGVLTALWLLGLTNLFHRLDAINGLAGGAGLVLMLLLACLHAGTGAGFSALSAVGMAGALLGFLVYNLPPTRIGLGGGGAGLIGFLVGSFSLLHPDKESATAAALVLVLPILGVWLAVRPIAQRTSPIAPSDLKSISRRLTNFAIRCLRSRS